jgi:DNA-binding NarL/FixJ family response regulator
MLSPTVKALPAGLRIRNVAGASKVIIVSFSLDRVRALTPAELHVARLVNAGHSNEAVARLRGTSTHTVARQVSRVLKKLRVGSRLALGTIPEIRV